MSPKKQSNLHDGEYRCERCWSEKNINLYPKSQFVDGDAKGFVILCEKCLEDAPPEKDPKEFEQLYLRFASPKEFIQYYDVKNEKEAKELWKQEVEDGVSIPQSTSENIKNVSEGVEVENKKTPYGFELIDGKLLQKQDEVKYVEEIFQSYLLGNTMEKIARDLIKKNESIKWSLTAIREILKNPIYAGYEFRGANLVKADFEKIVEPEIFNEVQQKIVRNIRNPKYLYKPLQLTS
jgi:hypothetical protein